MNPSFYNRSSLQFQKQSMHSQQQIEKARKHKEKILKKYLQQNQTKIFTNNPLFKISGLLVKDYDDQNLKSQAENELLSSQSSEDIQTKRKCRVDSSAEQNDDPQTLKKKLLDKKLEKKLQKDQNMNLLSSRKLRKKFKKAFGIQDDEELNEFVKQMRIEGMDLKQIKKLLKSKNVKLNIQAPQQTENSKKENKRLKKQLKKVKKDKRREKLQEKVKFQTMLSESESSDIQVPDHARTIYRNKDGTIKMQTQAEVKQKKKKEVYDKLADWQKGMKPQDSDQQDNDDLAYAKNSVWDDPLKLWNQQNIVKPFQCKYQGPGNRFNIKPGHRWDGVIRGNGFQNRLIQQQNLKKAKQAREHKDYLKNL